MGIIILTSKYELPKPKLESESNKMKFQNFLVLYFKGPV